MRSMKRCSCLLTIAFLACPSMAHALTHARAADNIAYGAVQALGYDGVGVITAVIDTAYVYQGHATFYTAVDNTTSRVTKLGYYGGAMGWGGHPTAVGGIIGGLGLGDGTYMGIAPRAQIWSASTSGKEPDIRQAYLDFSAPDSQGKSCQIYAMSLAAQQSDGGQYTLTAFVDWMATNRNSLIAVPAGNSGSYIWVPGGNYNQITVGGLDASGLHYDSILAHGPTSDGRSKPDILAPSASVWLPGLDAAPNDYYLNPGPYTSIATPFVTGVAALVREYGDQHSWTWDPRVAKAVILNGATKLKGWTHTSTQPLDEYQGAGRLNAEWTVYNYAAGEQAPGAIARRGWDLCTFKGNQTETYTFSTTAKAGYIISATMDWWRWCSPTDDNLLGYNWQVTKFKNLDLYLYNSSNQIVAQSTSTVDSVEHIFFKVSAQDTYHLSVKMASGHSYDCEIYALAWNTLVPGDANGDGKVDISDITMWQEHYDPTGLVDNIWTFGDWNGDGKVDGADLALWQANYDPTGSGLAQPLTAAQVMAMIDLSATPGAEAYLSGVPEPATLGLLALGSLGLRALRRRRR